MQRNSTKLRQQHFPAGGLHSAAGGRRARLLSTAARQRAVLAAKGVPSRERGRARELPLCVPGTKRRAAGDLQVCIHSAVIKCDSTWDF